MFQFFRRKDTAVRVFLGALLVLVCVMMVVTLIPGLTDSASSDDLVVARVGKETITGPELTKQIQMVSRGSRLPASLLPLYAPQVLNQMINDKAVLQEAERLGLRVSQEELAANLATNGQFFPDGKFIGEDQYRAYIEQRFNMSVPQFEERYRQAMVLDKLRRLMTAGVAVSDPEVDREFHRRNDKMRFEYVLLKTDDVKKTLQPSDAELKEFLDKNRQRYQVPERRQFRFVFADTAKLAQSVTVDEKELQRFYDQNKDQFRVQDRARVSHILLKTVGKSNDEVEGLRKKAEELLARARKGEDFATLAKQSSDDAGTSGKGGDLGWVVRGQTVPEFEKAAFTLEPNTISDLVRTTYGFHIIKVHERERAHQQTLQEVRDQIVPQVQRLKASDLAQELSRKAQDVLRKSSANLDAVARELALPVNETGLLKRGEALPQAGSSPAAEEALFAKDLKPGVVTPALTVPNGFIIAALVQVSPAHQAEMAEVRDQLVDDWKTDRAGQVLVDRMQAVRDQARETNDLKKAAASQKLEVKASDLITRDGSLGDAGPASALGDAAFSMQTGQFGGPVRAGEGQIVFRVVERQTAEPAQTADAREQIRTELLDKKRDTYFQVYLDALRARLEREGKLKVDQAAMQRLTAAMEQ